jgi:Fe2+ or Zn2+ uptake regulation protein
MDDDAMRAWAATQAEVESLRASVARLTAERDAVAAVLSRRTGLTPAEVLDAAVRRAAGLEEEPPR